MKELAALDTECRALSAVLLDLAPDDFDRPTNCPPWNLKELVVHIAMSIKASGDLPGATDGAITAADYYRRPERDQPQYRQANVERTRDVAATVLADGMAAVVFDIVFREALTALRNQEPGRVVMIGGRGPMVLADWVATRVMSVAAHGLDVAISLGREPWTTGPALAVARPVLVDLLGAPVPAGWDDQTLLAAGTGRRALTPADRTLLGPAADRFPLLS